MEGERFDVIVRGLAGRIPRRDALSILAGVAFAALRGRAAAQVGVTACRQRLATCERRDDCCEAQASLDRPIGCARVSKECQRAEVFSGERCCGREDARCANSCACCRNHVCRGGRCRRIDGACLDNFCCACYRCAGDTCEFVRCVTAGGFRECVKRCGPGVDAVEGVTAPGTTFACGERGRCRVVCEERRSGRSERTVQRWGASRADLRAG